MRLIRENISGQRVTHNLELSTGQSLQFILPASRGINDLEDIQEVATNLKTSWSCIPGNGSTRLLLSSTSLSDTQIRLQIFPESDITAALREVEDILSGQISHSSLSSLFGAILSAHKGANYGISPIKKFPSIFASFSAANSCPSSTHWSIEDLENQIDHCMEKLISQRTIRRPKAGPLDIARFTLLLSEKLWDPVIRKSISRVHFSGSVRNALTMLASARLNLEPEVRLKVAGVTFILRDSISKMSAWPQIMEWGAGNISKNILKYLTGYRYDYTFDLSANDSQFIERASSCIDPYVSASLSRDLFTETASNSVCEAAGSFRAELPEITSLHSCGINAIRVWLHSGKGMWVAFEQEDRPKMSFLWQTNPPHVTRWVLNDRVIPLVHATLTALWRDLKVGGKSVMLPLEESSPNTDDHEFPEKTVFSGKIKWGSDHDLESILRQAYEVEGHLRKLPRGKRASSYARNRARKAGISLEKGYTFVKRHKRGEPEDNVRNIPIRAQGLAKLVLSQQMCKTKNMPSP